MSDQTAANAVIQRVVNGLVDTLVKEWNYIYKFQSNVRNVEAKVEELKGVEGDVDQEVIVATRGGKVIGLNVDWWKSEVNKIKNQSDKILKDANRVNSALLKRYLYVPQRFSLSRKAAQLDAEIAKFLQEGKKHCKLEHGLVPAGHLPGGLSINSDDLNSRKELTNKVKAALQKEDIYIIGICGMAGVGKTRLADEVTSRVFEEKLFDAVVKVEVSKDLNIPEIQSVIAQNLGLKLEETDEDGRARRLRSRLTDGSKNLIILDNIWDVVPLHRVGLPLLGEQKGCKVIVTSQIYQLLWNMKAQIFKVKPLSKDEGRLLFKKIARIIVREDIANDVADECAGLPLVIDTVASALGNRDLGVWEDALDQLRESTTTMDDLVYSRIKLSYDLLGSSESEANSSLQHQTNKESEAQRLLLLCCLFPEGADIPYQKLVRYVKGLQLLNVSDNLVKTSKRVLKLLDDLKNRSLLLRGDKETTVKMNHVVRHVCLSISSKEDKNRLKVIHNPKLMQWPDEKERLPYTGISLTFGDKMKQLPDGLDYPGLELLQLQFHGESLKMSVDFFKGMKEVRVLDFKRMTLWGKFIHIDALPPILKFLTNLRTLCIEFCDLSTGDLSLIEGLEHLEVLSFFCSKLVNLPLEIKHLTNLKLLDLRCAGGPLVIPSQVLPALTKLEELYLGNYDSWSGGTVQRDNGNGISITELSSLPLLNVLQLRVKYPRLLLALKDVSWFERLRRFQIAAIRKDQSFHEYEIGKSVIFDGLSWKSPLDPRILSLLRKAENLTLKATNFENLFSVCSNLQSLDLDGGDVQFIMETGDSAEKLNNLKRLEIKWMEELEALCDGDLPLKSLVNLETVKLDSLLGLKRLWNAPLGSGCLGHLKVLEMSDCAAITSIFPFSVAQELVQLERLDIKGCEILEWIVSKDTEGIAGENIVLKKLSFLSLDDLPCFKSFFPDSGVKTSTEISEIVDEQPVTSEKAEDGEKQGCVWFSRKQQVPRIRESSPEFKGPFPSSKDFNHEAQQLVEDNVESTVQPLFNQLVELPSMNKLMVGSNHNLKHIVDDQTSRVSVSKIRVMYVSWCGTLLSIATSNSSIRSLQNLEKVNIDNCGSMEAMFDFENHNVEKPSADPMLSKLETVTLLNLSSLKHVFRMVPKETSCFQNLKSLEISSCENLKYVFSVSATSMLRNLQDLKVKGSALVEEIIEIDGSRKEVTDTIKFSSLRVLHLDNLASLTSFSSGNYQFEFPILQVLFIQKCQSMNKFCGGKVNAPKLKQIRVSEDLDQLVSIKDGLNKTLRQLHDERVKLVAEIEEV